jgi:hypothetical protein
MKKTFIFMSVAITALTFAACAGQGNSKSENNEDSVTVAATQDSASVNEEVAEEATVAEPVLNASLFGKWSNHNDPMIYMVLAETKGTYDGYKGFGYLAASNDYYENEFTLVFTSLTPDGDNIKVHYNKMESYNTGDPDDLGGDDYGEWVEEKVGEGDLVLTPQGNKVKIQSKESRIKNATLSKA